MNSAYIPKQAIVGLYGEEAKAQAVLVFRLVIRGLKFFKLFVLENVRKQNTAGLLDANAGNLGLKC